MPTCPVCNKPIDLNKPENTPFLPFCGERCRTIDLGRWFGEGYSVPVETRRLAEELLEDVARDAEEPE